jgi:hypothetical protein
MKSEHSKPLVYTDEPKKTWDRLTFDDRLLDGKGWQERAEIESSRDLAKSVEQLLCDYHDLAELIILKEHKNEAKSDAWYLVNAQKRMVSMMAKVTLSNDRLSKHILWLTVAAVLLAVVQVGLGLVQLLVAMC